MSSNFPAAKRPVPPSFEDFSADFERVLNEAIEKRRSSGVIAFLRKKVPFALSKTQAELILKQIQALPDFETVEFLIMTEAFLGPRGSRALSAIAAEIGSKYRAQTSFYEYMANVQPGTQSSALQQWLAHLRSVAQAPASSSKAWLQEARVLRAAFGCLLMTSEREDFEESCIKLLKNFCSPNSMKAKGQISSPSGSFARSIAKLLRPSLPTRGQIQLLLTATETLNQRTQEYREQRNRIQLQLDVARRDYEEKIEELDRIRQESAAQKDTIAELEARIAERNAAVLEERKRSEALDKHWEVVLQQELAGLAARLRRQLEHEISEIQLCLTGERPNLQMASDRLARVVEIIAALKGN